MFGCSLFFCLVVSLVLLLWMCLEGVDLRSSVGASCGAVEMLERKKAKRGFLLKLRWVQKESVLTYRRLDISGYILPDVGVMVRCQLTIREKAVA